MCGSNKAARQQQQQAAAANAAQEQSLALQREQMELQRQQIAAQQAQYQEQLAVSRAAPPPAPNPSAMAARGSLEMPTAQGAVAPTDTAAAATEQTMRAGVGRRKLRTDLAPVATLAIPGVA